MKLDSTETNSTWSFECIIRTICNVGDISKQNFVLCGQFLSLLKSDDRFAVYATFKRSLNCIHGHRVKQHKRFKQAALFIFGDVWMRLSSRLMVRKWLRIKMRCNGFLHCHFPFLSKRIPEEKKLQKKSRSIPMGYHRRDNMLGHFWTQSLHLWKRTWLTERISLQKLQLKTQDKAAGLKVVVNSSAAQEISGDGY